VSELLITHSQGLGFILLFYDILSSAEVKLHEMERQDDLISELGKIWN